MGVEEVLGDIPAAVVVVEAGSRRIVYANPRARQMTAQLDRSIPLDLTEDWEIFHHDGPGEQEREDGQAIASLTHREREVLKALAAGLDGQTIAEQARDQHPHRAQPRRTHPQQAAASTRNSKPFSSPSATDSSTSHEGHAPAPLFGGPPEPWLAGVAVRAKGRPHGIREFPD